MMSALLIFVPITFIILGLYVLMIISALKGWKRLEVVNQTEPTLGITVLVAARNEQANIEHILQNLRAQNYPNDLFQIILIDDHSEDDTFAVAEQFKKQIFNLSVLKLENGTGKKAALDLGIAAAKFPMIATIDADCRVGSDWLATMSSHWTNSTKMLLGPVILGPSTTVFESMQSMEMMAIMGLTGGFAQDNNPIMANGANLMFDKKAFEQVGGYSSEANPSGDDVFTMLKMNETWPGSIGFVKHYAATVQAAPQSTLKGFWEQRKRWLSKKGRYKDTMVNATAILSFLANLSGLYALIFALLLFGSKSSDLLLWFLLIKTVIDLILIRHVRNDLNPNCGIGSILLAELFILVYVPVLGIFGRVKNYVWKGRNISVK